MSKQSAKVWLRQQLRMSDKSQAELATLLGVKDSTFRSYVERAKLPMGMLQSFAKHTGISIDELRAHGIDDSVRTRKATCTGVTAKWKDTNIIPLLKVVGEACLDSLTFPELVKLMEIRAQLRQELTVELIKELLKRM